MNVFAASTVNNVVNQASQIGDKVMAQANVIANFLGVSSGIVLIVALYLMFKVGKKAVSTVLFVIAIILACIFFFGKEPVYQFWAWLSSMLGLA